MRRRNFLASVAAFAAGERTAAAQNPQSGSESPKLKRRPAAPTATMISTARGIPPCRIEFRTPTSQQRAMIVK